jgi:AraC-like DNA-binding protein
METIGWIGFSTALYAAILMMTKKERSDSDKILVAWLSLLSFEFLTCAIDYGFFGNSLLSSSFLLFNPAFYLYVASLTRPDFKLRYLQLIHLLPYLFFEVVVYVVRQPMELRSYFAIDNMLWFRSSFTAASVISWVVYNTLSAMMVVRHRRRLEHEFSTIESHKKIGWLLFVVIFYNLYCGFAVIIGVVSVLVHTDVPVLTFYSYSTLLLLIYILGFYGLKQPAIFKPVSAPEDLKIRYSKSLLGKTRRADIFAQVQHYLLHEKAYLNPELNMDMLSDVLGIPKHNISEAINMELGKNFFQLVNEYRVEAVKKRLATNTLFTVETIGYECGFSSKSTFYAVFRRLTGKSPNEWGKS